VVKIVKSIRFQFHIEISIMSVIFSHTSIFSLGGHITISGCWLIVKISVFELAMADLKHNYTHWTLY